MLIVSGHEYFSHYMGLNLKLVKNMTIEYEPIMFINLALAPGVPWLWLSFTVNNTDLEIEIDRTKAWIKSESNNEVQDEGDILGWGSGNHLFSHCGLL